MSSGRYYEMLQAVVRFAGANAAIATNRGVTSVVRNGTGDYQIVLDTALDALECSIAIENNSAAPLDKAYVHTSDTSKQILFLDNAGAAQDPTAVVVKFYQYGYGTGL